MPRLPALCLPICDVLKLCPKPEMGRVHASPVVARVKNNEVLITGPTDRQRAMNSLVSHMVSLARTAVVPKAPVARGIHATNPHMALAFATHIVVEGLLLARHDYALGLLTCAMPSAFHCVTSWVTSTPVTWVVSRSKYATNRCPPLTR